MWEYVLSIPQAGECIDEMEPRVGAIGHTHVAVGSPQDEMARRAPPRWRALLRTCRRASWLVNPGSVGQPRDGDPRAAWLALDLETWTAEWRRVEYPIAEAAEAIEAAGLPRSLGERLYIGQ